AYDSKGSPYTRETKADDPATLAWKEHFDVPVTILAKDAADVELVIDPALGNAAQGWLRPGRVVTADGTVIRGVRIGQDYAGDPDVEWYIEMRQLPPMGLAFDVFLRDASGVEAQLGNCIVTSVFSSSPELEVPAVLAALKRLKGAQGD